MFNPFPGLRSFASDEDHLFFGREKEIDELLRRLRSTRFLSVVGSSGSGKSSLILSGLIPTLYSGFMVSAGSSWRVAVLRPGENPIKRMAASLAAPDVLGTNEELGATNEVLLEATLRRGSLGLVQAVRQASIPPSDNLLVVVDQFEELFRYGRSRRIESFRDETAAFVKLLLEAAEQKEVPLYVVITMRSDFIGDCVEYPGLPEAINAGLYLVPRMTRDEVRSAITGPVAVGGGEITSRLVLRLLNDLGDEPDQLPVLQHVLMRTWDHWQQHGNLDEPIDISDYEAVGTLRRALYLHAEEAYEETGSDRGRLIAERLFKALTDTFSDQRGVRRPTSIQELAAICQATEEEIIRVVEIFRRAGRSFLMPPTDIQLGSSSVIDISHESLMRCWDRLIGWAEQERVSANSYIRIAQAAAWFEEGAGGLWRDPELELALQWKSMNQPTVAWADRYVVSFVRAMDFLDRSKAERDRVVAEVEKERKTKLRHAQWAAAVLGLLLVVAGVFFIAERIEKKRADMNQARADMNFLLTEDAMNGMLTLAGNEPGRVSEDVPQLDQLRKQLAQKVERLYRELTKQKPDSEGLREEEAVGYVGLGDSDRLLEHDSEAVNEYKLAIDQFESLAKDAPDKPKYRQEAANAYDSLGLVLAGQKGLAADAENAYNHALNIQEELSHSDPGNTQYQQDLARSYYNRGILSFDTSRHADSESDFRKAILLLEPLGESARENVGLNPSQELARVYNNLASVLRRDKNFVEAKWFYQKALGIDERAVQRDPTNRDTKLELAWFYNNLAAMESEDMKDSEAAKQTNGHALALIEQLADPAPSLSLDLARTHDIRGLIFHGLTAKSGLPLSDVESHEYLQSMEILEKLENVAGTRDLPKFKNQVTELVNIYLYIAKEAIESGSLKDAQGPLGNVSRLLQDLPEEDQLKFAAMYHELQQSLREKTVNSR